MTIDVTVIDASKTKTILIVFVSAIFVLIGGWMLSLSPESIESKRRMNIPLVVYALGGAGVLFFGLGVVGGIWRLFSRKPALELNSDGVKIFYIGTTILVSWKEITGLSVYEIHNQKMLVIKLRNPNKYINRGGNFRRALARQSFNMCGSPISISSNSLKLKFQELIEVFEKYLDRYGHNA